MGTVDNNTILLTIAWKNADVYTPQDIELPIIYCTGNNKMGVFKNTYGLMNGKPYSHWKWLKEKYNIKWWCYQWEILPSENN